MTSPGGDVPRPVADPRVRLRILRGVERLDGWLGDDAAALAFPRPGEPGRAELRTYPLGFLPGVLADLLDLGPRPAPGGRTERRVKAAVLAAALAGAGPERAQLAGLLVEPVALTRIEAEPVDGSRGASLEVLDTAGGLWLVRAEGGDAVLAPTTATRVFRGLVRLTQLALA